MCEFLPLDKCLECIGWIMWQVSVYIFKIFYLLFREKGMREKERERNIGLREQHCLTCAPRPGITPTAQACALTKEPTVDLLLWGMTPNQPSHTSHGRCLFTFEETGKLFSKVVKTFHFSWWGLRVPGLPQDY